MTAKLVDGRAVAAASLATTAELVKVFVAAHGYAPGLATLLVGEDAASAVYVRSKRKMATEVGLADFHRRLEAAASQEDVAAAIDELGQNPGSQVFCSSSPCRGGLDSSALIDRIPAAKDVYGLTTLNQGRLIRGEPGLRPCTPSGVIELLDSAGVQIDGAAAVVVGRSALVGHLTAELLLERSATVTIAHSRTIDLESYTTQADILIAAAGVPGLITAGHVKPGAAVVDVGIHRGQSGLIGDVRFDEVPPIAGWITPVPGGVGPMTIASLMSNTIAAAEAAVASHSKRDIP